MADEKNQDLENQTLDKIENPKQAKEAKRSKKFHPTMDLLIALFLVGITLAMIAWWYVEINKV